MLRSGAVPVGPTPINEVVTLDEKNLDQYTLTADAAQAVSFGGVTNAHVVIVSADRPITVRLTSAAGAVQAIPVDDQIVIISRTSPFTAITLTRTPATLTNVNVFLGEKA
jgi:hypothetical protein